MKESLTYRRREWKIRRTNNRNNTEKLWPIIIRGRVSRHYVGLVVAAVCISNGAGVLGWRRLGLCRVLLSRQFLGQLRRCAVEETTLGAETTAVGDKVFADLWESFRMRPCVCRVAKSNKMLLQINNYYDVVHYAYSDWMLGCACTCFEQWTLQL